MATLTRKKICRSTNPATCRYHGNPNRTHTFLQPTPEQYRSIPDTFNMGEEVFNETNYIGDCTNYLKNLTPEQLTSIKYYVQAGYNDINSALYGNGPVTAELRQHVENLDQALKTAPQAPAVLWRSLSGFTLPNQFNTQTHKIGDTLEFKGYTSTSQTPSAIMHIPRDMDWYMKETPHEERLKDPDNPYKYVLPEGYTDAPAKNVFFMIKTRTAAPVSVLRGTTAEQEWLLPRGLKFRITNIHQNRTLTGGHMNSGTRATIYEIEEI